MGRNGPRGGRGQGGGSKGGGKRHGGGRGAGGRGAVPLLGRPKPALPTKVAKELGLGDKSESDAFSDGDEDARDIRMGLPAAQSDEEPADDGPGNSTRAYVPGGHTRAQGGGGLYGISKRKAERKAAKAAAKQKHVQQQAERAKFRHAQQQQHSHAGAAAAVKAAGNAGRSDPQAKSATPKAAAKAKPPAQQQQQQQQQQHAQSKQQKQKEKRKRPEAELDAKRQPSKNAKFEEFLGDLADTGRSAIEAEKRHFRQLAKKLKLRKGRKSTIEDGLDDLTAGITTAGMDSDSGADAGSSEDGSSEQDSPGGLDSGSGSYSEDDLLPANDGAGSSDECASSGDMSSDEDAAGSDGFSSGEEDSSDEEGSIEGSLDEGLAAGEGGASGESSDDALELGGRQTAAAGGAYVPPAMRAKQRAGGGQVQQRVRGLLNRLAESNLAGIATDVSALMPEEGRLAVTEAINDELLNAAAEGPRATDAFAAVASAFVAGVSAVVDTQEIGARFLAALAARLEAARDAHDGLACHNLAMVAVHAYLAGLMGPAVMYSLLAHLTRRFEEQDVAMLSAALRAAGLHLRSADPGAMKDFLVAVHARAAEAAAAGLMSSRAEVMLSLLLDIKNNRQRGGGGGAIALTAGTTKWLKSVGALAMALTSLSWDKLLAPSKKGLWWLPAAGEALPQPAGGAGVLGGAAAAADSELLRLAAAARMNTDVRRAVFCCVMGAEDATDAFERLLRLGLKGEAEREVVRVPAECCLQEAGWNPYYALLLGRLAAASTSHTVTLQYCLWDHFKGVAEAEPRRTAHLARLTASLISGGALPLSVLKVVRFEGAMVPREQLFWNLTLQHLLLGCADATAVAAVFERLATNTAAKTLRTALSVYLKRTFQPWAARRLQQQDKQQALDSLLPLLDTAYRRLTTHSL